MAASPPTTQVDPADGQVVWAHGRRSGRLRAAQVDPPAGSPEHTVRRDAGRRPDRRHRHHRAGQRPASRPHQRCRPAGRRSRGTQSGAFAAGRRPARRDRPPHRRPGRSAGQFRPRPGAGLADGRAGGGQGASGPGDPYRRTGRRHPAWGERRPAGRPRAGHPECGERALDCGRRGDDDPRPASGLHHCRQVRRQHRRPARHRLRAPLCDHRDRRPGLARSRAGVRHRRTDLSSVRAGLPARLRAAAG